MEILLPLLFYLLQLVFYVLYKYLKARYNVLCYTQFDRKVSGGSIFNTLPLNF